MHLDDLKMCDLRGEDKPASWLKRDTGSAEHLQALAVRDDSSRVSGVSRTPGDRSPDMNQDGSKVVNVRIAPRARVESPRSQLLEFRQYYRKARKFGSLDRITLQGRK